MGHRQPPCDYRRTLTTENTERTESSKKLFDAFLCGRAVADSRLFRFWSAGLWLGLRLMLYVRGGGCEELARERSCRNSAASPRCRLRLHSAVITADERRVDIGKVKPLREQRVG